MAINKKQVGVIVAGVAALALVGGGIAWAVGAGTSAAAESAASGSTEEQVQAASQFDLTSQNAKDRPTIEPVQAAVDALEASGFTPIEGQAHGRDLALGRAARRARLGRRRDRDRHGGGLRLLIADGLGLEYNLVAVNWADWPLGIQSGKYDLIASNVTVTEERKELYDFASYRQDLLGFYVNANSDIESIEGAEDISACKIVVGSGTNQEKILLAWNEELEGAGEEPAELVYYDDQAASDLAPRRVASTRRSAPTRPRPTGRRRPASRSSSAR